MPRVRRVPPRRGCRGCGRAAGAAGGADPGLGRRGDRAAQQLLAARLATERPSDAVLSEEAADDPRRTAAERVWIIDPLDGTREFAEPQRTDWAVHVALWDRGRLTAGAVALPARQLTLSTADTNSAAAVPARQPRIVVSRSRAPALAAEVAERVGGQLAPLGSAGAKTAAVVLGEADAYLHAGGQWEWDSAAPVAVALAHGLHAARLDGSPLAYNQPRPWLPDLLVCRPALADQLHSAIAAAGGTGGKP